IHRGKAYRYRLSVLSPLEDRDWLLGCSLSQRIGIYSRFEAAAGRVRSRRLLGPGATAEAALVTVPGGGDRGCAFCIKSVALNRQIHERLDLGEIGFDPPTHTRLLLRVPFPSDLPVDEALVHVWIVEQVNSLVHRVYDLRQQRAIACFRQCCLL